MQPRLIDQERHFRQRFIYRSRMSTGATSLSSGTRRDTSMRSSRKRSRRPVPEHDIVES